MVSFSGVSFSGVSFSGVSFSGVSFSGSSTPMDEFSLAENRLVEKTRKYVVRVKIRKHRKHSGNMRIRFSWNNRSRR
ncbi:MAG: pentapeptide repeat-containing protein [Pirellula sp.]